MLTRGSGCIYILFVYSHPILYILLIEIAQLTTIITQLLITHLLQSHLLTQPRAKISAVTTCA